MTKGYDRVLHATNLDGFHAVLLGDATQVRPEAISEWWRN